MNSYTRLIPGFWAPTDASWGVENRTCALRVIPGSEKSQRVEYRVAAADINPYIALAAAIGSGLWGIENRIEPDAPVQGNSYDMSFPEKRQLPRTLMEAAQRLKASKAARGAVRRRFRRPLCRDPRMGGARVPQGHHRLGDGALLRDHLEGWQTARRLADSLGLERENAMTDIICISPIDGKRAGRRAGWRREAEIEGALARARARRSANGARVPIKERSEQVLAFLEAMLAMNQEVVPELAQQMGRPVRYRRRVPRLRGARALHGRASPRRALRRSSPTTNGRASAA